jgi:hypothetical protein
MLIFSSTNQRSLSVKTNKLIKKPKELVTPIDHKYSWSNSTVPIINKKYCEIRSNFNLEVKQMYIGEIWQQLCTVFTRKCPSNIVNIIQLT